VADAAPGDPGHLDLALTAGRVAYWPDRGSRCRGCRLVPRRLWWVDL